MARPSRKRAELAATALLTRVGATRPEHIDPVTSAKALGLEVVFGQLDGATARICHDGTKARIRVSDQIVLPGRMAFSIAHEIGHYVLGHTIAREGEQRNWAHATCEHRPPHEEREADTFASTHTMPAEMVRAYCDLAVANLYTAGIIARTFPASPVASARRLVDLSPAACAVAYSADGRVRWTRQSRRFPGQIAWGSRLDQETVAAGYFARAVLDPAPRALPATIWVPNHRGSGEIVEHAQLVPEPGWGGVLSMLSLQSRSSTI